MKMTKKITMAVLAALAFTFVGCGDVSLTDSFQKKYGDDVFKYSDNDYEDGLGKWTIQGTNESETEYQRGMQLLQTKHSDIAGLISLKGQNGGVVGLVFDVTQNKDKDPETKEKLPNYDSFNFCVAGIRNIDGNIQYYVSYYANISEDNMKEDNFGTLISKDANGKKTYRIFDKVQPDCLEPYEIEIKKYTALPNLAADENGVLTAVLYVTEYLKDTGAPYPLGSYEINVYDGNKDLKGKSGNLKIIEGTTPQDHCVIYGDVIGKDGPEQAKVGVYANVYPKVEGSTATLDATVQIINLTHSAIVE